MANTLLTDSKIRGVKPKKHAFYIWHASAIRGAGRLGVRVYPSGRKVFVHRHFKNGAETFIPIGKYPEITLSQALTKHNEIQKELNKKEKSVNTYATVGQLLDDYISDQIKRGRRSYEKTENRFKQITNSGFLPRGMLAKDVTSTHIRHILADFIRRGAIAGSNKARSNLHAAFNFGLKADNDPLSMDNKAIYGLNINPVSLVPKQKDAEKALDRFLSWDELSTLIIEMGKPDNELLIHPDFASLTLLCVYTGGQRPYELITNTRDNIDYKNATLTIPPHISKTEDFHVVPLSPAAIDVLKKVTAKYDSPFIFHGETKEGHLSTSEFAKQIKIFCEISGFSKFTPRDIRRTFKTLAGDMGISSEMRDILQNHIRPGVSKKHYDRYEYLREKRELIALWDEKLIEIVFI